MADGQDVHGDDEVARRGSAAGELPERPLPPPPTLRELAEVLARRWRLRHPSLDAGRLVLMVAALVGVGGMAWAVWSPHGASKDAAPVHVVGSSTSSTRPSTVAPTTTTPAELVVDVAGAVRHPGPVRVAGDARVADALAAAGGTGADADLERVDRAAPLRDGQRVYVPRVGQRSIPDVVGVTGGEGTSSAPATGGGETSSGPVNVNTADAQQLTALPGVGPATAQAILDYRTSNGPFTSVDQLLEVRGIGPAKMATLRPHVTV